MSERNLVLRFQRRVERSADLPAMQQLGDGGARMTWREWGDCARHLAAHLVARGHAAGETAVIFAGNRLLWPVAELGLLHAGLTTVGVYPTSAPVQVQQIIEDSRATVVIVDSAARLAALRSVRAALPGVRTVIAESPDDRDGVETWTEALASGCRALAGEEVAAEIDRRARAIAPEQTAGLIYTSGSTGEPKGARISHRYVLASAESIRDTLGLTESDRTISFLPYSHAGERVFGLHTRVLCGMETGLLEDHTKLWEATSGFGPTLFGGMPRFYEKAMERLMAERTGAPEAVRARWDRAHALGAERSRLRRAGAVVPDELEREWGEAVVPARERLESMFGPRLRRATSGGATLPSGVAEELDAFGLTVLGAYGMTEQLCVAFYRPDCYGFEGVGQPMPGAEVRIAEDGEVLVRRCALTFDGYLGRPEDTRDAFTEDGQWLRTGDLGARDARGVLRITGRKKELIALSTGKKVAPLPIEARLTSEPLIAQAMLYGEGKKFVSALVTLRQPAVEAWARARRIDAEFADLVRHPELEAEVARAVARVNGFLSSTEQVRRFVVLPRELALEEEELTPTMKIRRPVVAERYREQLDVLYD